MMKYNIKQILLHPLFIKGLIIINFIGSIYGFYWYRDQLTNTPIKYWIYTPDSPMATFIFIPVLIFLLYKKKNDYIFILAFVNLIKYGLWAVFVNTHYWFITGNIQLIEVLLWLSHLGMAVEGFLYLMLYPPSIKAWILVSLWSLWNDYVDYFWDLHPYLYLDEQLSTVTMFTLCLTCVIIVITGLLIKTHKNAIRRR